MAAAVGAMLALSACGGGQRQDANEPKGTFHVDVSAASFPASQTLSQHSQLVITVRNTGHRTIPDVAVTVCNATCAYPAPKGEGTSSAAFGAALSQSGLANPSRAVWIIDQSPGGCGYSCANGGAGGGATAYANTWALGRLRPGKSVSFDWKVTAVQPGHHVLAWEVAAGLNGRAHAELGNGSLPHGRFAVDISATPAQSYVDNNGNIVQGSGQ